MNENNKNGYEVIRNIANMELCSISAKIGYIKSVAFAGAIYITNSQPDNNVVEDIFEAIELLGNAADAQASKSLGKIIDNAQAFSQGQTEGAHMYENNLYSKED